MDLMEALARAAAQNGGERAPPILPEAAIMRLREVAERYAEQLKGPRFKVGDIITPARDSDHTLRSPHLVVETRDTGPDFSVGEVGANDWGQRRDMRVLYVASQAGHVVTSVWVESFAFVRWGEEGETA